MTNFKSDHNGYYKIPVNQLKLITCNDFLNSSSTLSNFKKQFPCNICFILLFIIQISSTCLMLISVAFTIKMISADSQFVNQSSKVFKNLTLISGNNQTNIESNRDFFRVFLRNIRSLSTEKPTNFTLLLTKDNINSICLNNYLVHNFRKLTHTRLRYCDMFNVSSVIYSYLVNDADMQDISNVTFLSVNFSISFNDKLLNEIPEILLKVFENGTIFSSKKSIRQSISQHFTTTQECIAILTQIMDKDDWIEKSVKSFNETLRKNHCESELGNRTSSVIYCAHCEVAYKNWLCTQTFDLYVSVHLPNSNSVTLESENFTTNPQNHSALVGIKSCPEWCSKVETNCPYFTPIDGYGGEPAFLCDESHYHHSARYRLKDKSRCGADMPFMYCCYSEIFLLGTQMNSTDQISSDMYSNTPPKSHEDQCSPSQQWDCITKLISSFYKATSLKSVNNSVSNNDNYFHNYTSYSHPVSIFQLHRYQLTLMICISSSFFLYFYTDFSIR